MCKYGILQGDRTSNVGVVDREYILHKGIQTLGGSGPPAKKVFALPFLPFSVC
jgi:hypothetical protein